MAQMSKNGISPIPLGQRIGEIMEEKGAAYTIRAFSARIEIKRETLRMIIKGERPIKPSELELISKGLNITSSRLKQEDIQDAVKEVHLFLDTFKNQDRALERAEYWTSKALGITEKYESLNLLGRAYFHAKQFEKAHHAWLEAYSISQEIYRKHDDKTPMYEVLCNLMLSCSIRKEYSYLAELIQKVESAFQASPNQLGSLCYSRAMILYRMGDIEGARIKLYDSLRSYEVAGDQKNIGIAQRNVAYIEYRIGNYLIAKEYYERAIERLVQDTLERLLAVKDYVKTLLKLKQRKAALDWITNAQRDLKNLSDHNLEAKFQLLYSVAANEAQFAEIVAVNSNMNPTLRVLACQFLIKYFLMTGDVILASKYHEIATTLSNSDILDEEDL